MHATTPSARRFVLLVAGCLLAAQDARGVVDYDVVYGDGKCAVSDPFVSFDARSILYSYFYDQTDLNSQRDDLPRKGADVFRIHLDGRAIERLTFGEFTPNTGAGKFDESDPLDPPPGYNSLGYGILNLGPCPVAGGRIAFTSNRNGFQPPKSFTAPTLQLFVMGEDGENVDLIAPDDHRQRAASDAAARRPADVLELREPGPARTASTAWTPSTPRRTSRAATGSGREPTREIRQQRDLGGAHRRPRAEHPPQLRPARGPQVRKLRQRAHAHPGRDPRA